MQNKPTLISSFSVNDLDKAFTFYTDILNLTVTKNEMGILELKENGETRVFIYPKPDHTPATFTVLNIIVPNIDKAADELIAKHIRFNQYDNPYIKTDEKGISRGKPSVAWFNDPAGNVIAYLQEH